jgi:hypothetical protein
LVPVPESRILISSEIGSIIAGAKKQVVVYSGVLPICQDETGLACLLASVIANNIVELRCESLSHYIFARASAIPGIPLFIAAVILRPWALIAVPYIALWAAYFRNRDAAAEESAREATYGGVTVMARAG